MNSDHPNAGDIRAKAFQDREHPGVWRVEKMDENGGIEVAIFRGPRARERAVKYADHIQPLATDDPEFEVTWLSSGDVLVASPTCGIQTVRIVEYELNLIERAVAALRKNTPKDNP
jgi:hypothetical protein